MHVLFVSHYTLLYGANRSLIDLMLALRSSGVKTTVLLPAEGPVVDELRRHDLPHMTVPFKKSVHRRRGPLSLLGAIRRHGLNVFVARRNIERLRQMQIDVVHTNSSVTSFGWMLSKMLQVPHVWHVRESLPLDYELYHDFGAGVFQRRLAASARTIPISHFLSQQLLSQVPQDKKQVIYNGVFSADSLTRLATLSTSKRSQGKFTFAIVGRMGPGKNQLEAVRAAEILFRFGFDFQLVIVGDGTPKYTRRLQAEIQRAGLGDVVELTGYLDDVDEIYRRTDVLLVCARHEGLGRVTIEAMARGIPVIGYRGGATRELVDDGVNGLLYVGGETELAQCMQRVLDDPELAAQLAGNTRRQMSQFTTENCAAAIHQVLRDVSAA